MRLITERTLIRAIADRWREQYGLTERDPEKIEIQRKLDALDKDKATADKVEKIIGNGSWTKLDTCDECGRQVRALIELGEPPDYESSTAEICRDCLRKALALRS